MNPLKLIEVLELGKGPSAFFLFELIGRRRSRVVSIKSDALRPTKNKSCRDSENDFDGGIWVLGPLD